MGLKFDSIFESVVSRYTSGGYLAGDLVIFRSNYKSSETYKLMPTAMQTELDELVKSGLNIKVTQTGNNLSGVTANNQHKGMKSTVITVAGDHGGGRMYGQISVTPDMIDLVDGDGVNLPEIPDEFVRKDNTNYKPEKYVAPKDHTSRRTDKGNGKNTPTDLKLAGESTLLKNDNNNLAMLYEDLNEVDFEPIYENLMLNEGFLRRMASKLVGGGDNNPLKNKNKTHQFAKSIALDAGKDISKSFGGDFNTHANNLYDSIYQYITRQLGGNRETETEKIITNTK